MSLAEPSVMEVAKKQYQFKLKAYLNFLVTMIAVQVLALLFSTGGVRGTGMSTSSLFVSLRTYSSDIIVIFTGFWVFVMAILIVTKEYRYGDYIFPTNRASANLANIAYLLTVGVFGGVTAILGWCLSPGAAIFCFWRRANCSG